METYELYMIFRSNFTKGCSVMLQAFLLSANI